MKRLGIFLLTALTVQLAVARPILNLNGRGNAPRVDRRAGQFANTCEPASQSADLDVNNVRTKLLNGGDMWWDLNNPKYEIPKISDPNAVRKHAMFAGAIWIGGHNVKLNHIKS